jgi:hypothetical protein
MVEGRQQVVTVMFVPCNPSRLGICVGVRKVSMAWHTKPGDLPVHLKFSSNSSHITRMIVSCSLYCYIRTCRLHVEIFFILYFPFILKVSPDVCPLSTIYHFYPCYELWSIMQVCNLIHAHARYIIPCPPLKKYK